MKKLAICFVLFLMVFQVYSVELWNGFTSDMTKEDVVTRANEILEPSKVVEDTYHNFLAINIFDAYYYKLPRLTAIKITSSSSKFDNNEENIIFSFHNNKLFAASVSWAANPEDLFILINDKYGYPIDYPKPNLYRWRLSDKDFFLFHNTFCIIDRQARENWIEEQIRTEQQKKADEKIKRESAINDVDF
jgi:hypothetical protein